MILIGMSKTLNKASRKKPQFRIRRIRSVDTDFMAEMLYEAIFVPDGAPPPPRSVIEWREISRYLENWGRAGDFGVVAMVDGMKAGAAWCRLFAEDDKGFGFVDERTPELTIALKKEFRGRGIGTVLLKAMIEAAEKLGFQAISLSVDERNKAAHLYVREGFAVVSKKRRSLTMFRAI